MNTLAKSDKRWFIRRDDVEHGPYGIADLHQQEEAGEMDDNTLVRLDAWDYTVRLRALGGWAEMKRLESAGRTGAGDLGFPVGIYHSDPEIARLVKRTHRIEVLQWLGVCVILILGLAVALKSRMPLGSWESLAGWIVWLLLPLGAWLLIGAIAASATSNAISSRCLLLEVHFRHALPGLSAAPGRARKKQPPAA